MKRPASPSELPTGLMLFAGMALGQRDDSTPRNALRTRSGAGPRVREPEEGF